MKNTSLRKQYIELTQSYFKSDAQIKISDSLLSPLGQDNPLTKAFWTRAGVFLDQNTDISFQQFCYTFICAVASALDYREFDEWHQLRPSEQGKLLSDAVQQISQLESTLNRIPQSPGIPMGQWGIKSPEDDLLTDLMRHLRWGEAKKPNSLLGDVKNSLSTLKAKLKLMLVMSDDLPAEYLATATPVKQVRDKEQSALINELVMSFKQLGTNVPRQLIVDVCHIFGFENVCEMTVKNAIKRINKHINQ